MKYDVFYVNRGFFFLMVTLLLIPRISVTQTATLAAPDSSIVPWLGAWRAMYEPLASDREPQAGSLEIRPTARGNGFEITRKDGQKSDSEVIIPDGFQRTIESNNCTGIQTFNWEQQTGLLMGSSEIKCKDAAVYNLTTIKMIVSPNRMADILVIKSSGQTRIAVRHFAFEHDLSTHEEGAYPDQATMAMRTALAAPWDLNKIIHLSKIVEISVLQAALLEKDVQVRIDAKSLKQMKATNMPKDVVDLLIALALPDKFKIKKNGKVAVAPYAPAAQRSAASTAYVNPRSPFNDFYGYYNNYGPFGPWGIYWSYHSPFWRDYPIYVYQGSPGGDVTPPPDYSDGRVSSDNGYVQVTPRDTGHRAVPRDRDATPSRSYSGSSTHVPSSGGSSSVSASSSSGGSYSGGGNSGAVGASSGGNSAPSASPSGYSGGGGGQAVPRN